MTESNELNEEKEIENLCEELNKLISDVNNFFNSEWRDKERYRRFTELLADRTESILERSNKLDSNKLNEKWTAYEKQFIAAMKSMGDRLTEDDYKLIVQWQMEEAVGTSTESENTEKSEKSRTEYKGEQK